MKLFRSLAIAGLGGALVLSACGANGSTGAATLASTASAASAASTASTASTAAAVAAPSGSTASSAAVATPAVPADAVTITLDGTSATVAADSGVSIVGGTVTITAAGTYRITGTLTDGNVVGAAPDDAVVRIVLDDAHITSTTTAPLSITGSDQTEVTLVGDSSLTDPAVYTSAADGPNAALWSSADLTIDGDGSLTVDANADDGITSKDDLLIVSGTITVTAADDAVRGKDTLNIAGGTLRIAAGGDALKSDNDSDATKSVITIDGGAITITGSNEGIEATTIVVNGGTIDLTSSDDGINGTAPDGLDVTPTLTVTGGTVVVNANGDGVDVNGDIAMSGGTLVVNGPTAQMNGAIDYDGTFAISGGVVVATGSSGMAMAPSGTGTSSQLSLLATFTTQPAGTTVHVESTDGTPIVTFTAGKAFSSLAVSSPELSASATYEVSVGGTASGTATNGLHDAADYTGGTVVGTTTTAAATTTAGRGPGR